MRLKKLIERTNQDLRAISKQYQLCKVDYDKGQESRVKKGEFSPEMDNLANKFAGVLYSFAARERDGFFFKLIIRNMPVYRYFDMLEIERKNSVILFKNSHSVIGAYIADNPDLVESEPLPQIPLGESFGFYGDCYNVSGAVCLITGHGKSKAIRALDCCTDISLDFVTLELTKDAVLCCGHEATYFIDMVGDDEIQPAGVTIVSANEYIKYARGNFRFSMENPFAEALIQECERRGIVFVLVPWMKTIDERTAALDNFFKTVSLIKTSPSASLTMYSPLP